jgi:hypothetical protein
MKKYIGSPESIIVNNIKKQQDNEQELTLKKKGIHEEKNKKETINTENV